MKTQNTNLLMEISNDQIQKLVVTVEETVAKNIEVAAVKTFSAADLWRIQSNRRIRTGRRALVA